MRIVIVTGGTAGLGRVMVAALLEAGHGVVAVGRSATGELPDVERLLVLHSDVSSPDACSAIVARTLDHFGAVDALINNAGINLPVRRGADESIARRKFYDVTPEQWRAIMRTNVDGSFFMAQAVAPHLIDRGWGRIVNHVTSYRTMVRGGEAPYGPSKAALEAMTAIWADELDGTGVTVNAILPGGAADTQMVSHDAFPDRSTLIPPAVMAAPIRWLLSDASNAVTGRRLTAAIWKPEMSDEANLAAASTTAGWAETVANSVARPWPPA